MPRLTDKLPKYRKHRASGQAVVTIAGRDVYLGPHGTKASKVEYDRVIAEWLAAGRPSSPQPSASDITLVEVMAAYLKYTDQTYVKNGRPTSEHHGVRWAMRSLKTLYGRTPAVEFGPLALKAVREDMIQGGVARSTVNQNISRIKRMFKWAVSEELIPASVHQALMSVTGLRRGKSSARETAPVLPVEDELIEATLPHLSSVIADMVKLQRLTGMRPGEVCIVRPCDIDRTGDLWFYRPESHKTEHHDRERVVTIGPIGQRLLAKYLLRSSEDFCFSPRDRERSRNVARREARKSPMTPSQRSRKPKLNRNRAPGEHYTPNSYRRAIQRACRNAGLSVWKPNQVRHTAATEIRQRFGLEAAQVALGHAEANVTQVYAERDGELAATVAREIG